MSHDAKVGARPRYDQAIRALSTAQRREASAYDKFADLLESASLAAGERARALHDGAKASRQLASAIGDRCEAERTERMSDLMRRQALQAEAEAAAGQTRARASRAAADRARAQAATNDSFGITQPTSRGARRGG